MCNEATRPMQGNSVIDSNLLVVRSLFRRSFWNHARKVHAFFLVRFRKQKPHARGRFAPPSANAGLVAKKCKSPP